MLSRKQEPSLIDKALGEIAADPVLSAQQKLERQAKVFREWRTLSAQPERTYGYSNRTGFFRTLGLSIARTFGSQFVRALFRGSR